LDRWYHLAFTYSNYKAFIYLNGNLAATGTSTSPPTNITRTANYVGRSNWKFTSYADSDTDADFDELKIFNRSLIQSEVIFEMNNDIYISNTTKDTGSGLIHYWSFNSTLADEVGFANLFGGENQ